MNNQPAFPAWELNGHGKPEMTCFGLTMLDYFAAKAMQGILASDAEATLLMNHADRAEFVYNQAEAMMAERAKRGL